MRTNVIQFYATRRSLRRGVVAVVVVVDARFQAIVFAMRVSLVCVSLVSDQRVPEFRPNM